MDSHMNGMLHLAAKAKNEEVVTLLLSFIKDKILPCDIVNMTNENDITPLEVATKTGQLSLVKCLLEAGAKANNPKHIRM